MTTGHLSEIELQQYALDESACAGELREHVAACDNCRTEVMVYRLLLTGIKEEPKAEFSFDVVGLVLSQLPEAGVGAVAPEAAGTEAVCRSYRRLMRHSIWVRDGGQAWG